MAAFQEYMTIGRMVAVTSDHGVAGTSYHHGLPFPPSLRANSKSFFTGNSSKQL